MRRVAVIHVVSEQISTGDGCQVLVLAFDRSTGGLEYPCLTWVEQEIEVRVATDEDGSNTPVVEQQNG